LEPGRKVSQMAEVGGREERQGEDAHSLLGVVAAVAEAQEAGAEELELAEHLVYVHASFNLFRAASNAAPVTVTDDEAKTFFEKNKETYRTPKQVKVRYAYFLLADAKKSVAITDADVADYYERNKTHYVDTNDVPEPLDAVVAGLEKRPSSGVRPAAPMFASRRVVRHDARRNVRLVFCLPTSNCQGTSWQKTTRLSSATASTPSPTIITSICTAAVGLGPPCAAPGPKGVAVDYVRNIALVANSAGTSCPQATPASCSVTVVDLNTRTVIAVLPTQDPPVAVGVNPANF
jgi:hypothetical protein